MSGSSSGRAPSGTSAGSRRQAPPPRAKGEPIEVENAPTGKAANDNALTRRAEVGELFREGQGTAAGRTGQTPEGTGQDVKRPPGWRKQPERLTSGNWAHENFESIEKILKPNAEKLVSEKLAKRLEKEHRIPVKGLPPRNQPRVDRVDWDNAEVIEIKPEGLRDVGEVEAKGYAEQMNIYEKRTDGKVWKGRCVTYNDEKVRAFLKKIGYLE